MGAELLNLIVRGGSGYADAQQQRATTEAALSTAAMHRQSIADSQAQAPMRAEALKQAQVQTRDMQLAERDAAGATRLFAESGGDPEKVMQMAKQGVSEGWFSGRAFMDLNSQAMKARKESLSLDEASRKAQGADHQ